MPCCVVPTCKNATGLNKKQDGITFHVFPADEKRKSDWTNIVKRARLHELWEPAKRSVVCSIHFEEKYFYVTKGGLRRLKKEAIPNKHLALALESSEPEPSTPKHIFLNLSVCATCKQLLERCYDFKQLCQKSNKILQDWKKKKKPAMSIDNLHSLIRPYYNKVGETNDDKKIETESEKSNNLDVRNNDNSILNNNSGIEFIGNNDNVIGIDDYDYNVEKLENWDDLLQHNDILKQSMEPSQLNLSTEPFEKTDLKLIDNEDNGIEDNSDDEHNRIGDDNECNGIENNCVIKSNRIENESDNDDNDSSDDLEWINKLLEDAQKKTIELMKKKPHLQKYIMVRKKKAIERKPLPDKESYESVFDIVSFTSAEEVKADFMERPNSEYYKNATAKCTICYTVFKNQKHVDYHMKWHDPAAGDHVCDICQCRFKSRQSLMKHRSDTHSGRYSCKKCPLVTYYTSVMRAHSKLHQGVTYKCKYCDVTTRHRQRYLVHLRRFHPLMYNRPNNMCTLCGRTFASPNGLQMHRIKKHWLTEEVETESSVRCDACDLTFINQQAYTVHFKNTHTDIATTLLCNAAPLAKPPKKRTSFTCLLCGQRFDGKKSLFEHKRQEHRLQQNAVGSPDETKVTCKECGAKGVNRRWLYNHCRTKHPKLPYEARLPAKHLCEQCGKSFRLRCLLTEHQHVHTGERPFACGECDRTFNNKLNLYLHSEWHKPPSRVCTVCGKKFVSASNLFNHMRVHIGDRRYKCSLCDKGFLHAAALHEHVRGVHQNVRRVRKPRQKEKQTEEE